MTFIELPCVQYGRLTGKYGYVTNHENTNYHKKAAAQAIAFVESVEHPERIIDQVLDKTLKESVEKNRQILVPMINTIVLAGRLGLALRGHRDDKPLVVPTEESNIAADEGNFRALL